MALQCCRLLKFSFVNCKHQTTRCTLRLGLNRRSFERIVGEFVECAASVGVVWTNSRKVWVFELVCCSSRWCLDQGQASQENVEFIECAAQIEKFNQLPSQRESRSCSLLQRCFVQPWQVLGNDFGDLLTDVSVGNRKSLPDSRCRRLRLGKRAQIWVFKWSTYRKEAVKIYLLVRLHPCAFSLRSVAQLSLYLLPSLCCL